MSGFGVYETLRIFLPGAIALLVLDLVLRLTTGINTIDVEEGSVAGGLVNLIENTTGFAILSVSIGLVLYLIDFPSRLRITAGDDTRNIQLPSSKFGAILEDFNSSHPDKAYDGGHSLSLFFIFADEYMPEELNKRVYLFGSLFRVFIDIRVLLWLAVSIGPVGGLIVAAEDRSLGDLSPRLSYAGAVGLLLAAMGLLGVFGERRFQQDYNRFLARRKQALRPADPPGGSAGPDEVPVIERFDHGVWKPGGMFGLAVVGLLLNSAAVALAYSTDGVWSYLSLGLTTLTWLLWFAVEIGPPRPSKNGTQGWHLQPGSVRNRLLRRLGLKDDEKPQLPILYRTLNEVVLAAPLLAAAALVGDLLDRQAESVLAWGLLLIPATLIMAIRKHETRQLSVYRHQNAFLELSSHGIHEALLRRSGLPSELSTGGDSKKIVIEIPLDGDPPEESEST